MGNGLWKEVSELESGASKRWTSQTLVRCDPYLVWSETVSKPSSSPLEFDFPVLVELTKKSDYPELLRRLNDDAKDLAGVRFIPNGFEPRVESRFITGRVNAAGLDALVSEVVGRRIERFSLQEARVGAGDEPEEGWKTYCEGKAAARGTALASIEDDLESTARPPNGTYLGIVDDGLPALRIRRAIQSCDQPAHFWDQGWQPPESTGTEINGPATNDPDWDVGWAIRRGEGFPARGFLYGRRLKPLPRDSVDRPCDGNEHARVRYFFPPPRQSHGAAVLGLMAPWLSEARGPVEWPTHISGLAMVQLPTLTVMDTSGGSLAMRVLDGLRYILWQEEADRPKSMSPRPVLANVSYGVHAGPHDGTSMFERAVLEMLEGNDHLHLVLPAGNAAQAGCHATRTLSRKGETDESGEAKDSAVFKLQVLPDNPRDAFMELWLPAGASVSLDIRPPGSKKLYSISQGSARIHFEPDVADPAKPQTFHFGAIYSSGVAQGTEGTMILVAIGSTRPSSRQENTQDCPRPRRRLDVAGFPGLWELTVRNLTSEPITVDAWVERGDAPPDACGGSRQAYFPDQYHVPEELSNATPSGTLNGIATMKHKRLHVVGAMYRDGSLSDYSAAGPARFPAKRKRPDVVVPADMSSSLPGIRTTGFLPGTIDRINGTSAASAVFARTRAEELGQRVRKTVESTRPKQLGRTFPVPTSRPQAKPASRGEAERRTVSFEVFSGLDDERVKPFLATQDAPPAPNRASARPMVVKAPRKNATRG